MFSKNIFFHLGISNLLETLPFSTTSTLAIFHTDCDCIYLMDTEDIKETSVLHDPIYLFLRCCRIEKTQKDIIIKMLNSKKLHKPEKIKREVLTKNEYRIIKKISHGLSQRKIAEQLNISVKTVSSQKINALRKLNINKPARFFVEYLAWLKLWREYVSIDNNQVI